MLLCFAFFVVSKMVCLLCWRCNSSSTRLLWPFRPLSTPQYPPEPLLIYLDYRPLQTTRKHSLYSTSVVTAALPFSRLVTCYAHAGKIRPYPKFTSWKRALVATVREIRADSVLHKARFLGFGVERMLIAR